MLRRGSQPLKITTKNFGKDRKEKEKGDRRKVGKKNNLSQNSEEKREWGGLTICGSTPRAFS